jgi:aldehyde dehydrogenase (NAD+)
MQSSGQAQLEVEQILERNSLDPRLQSLIGDEPAAGVGPVQTVFDPSTGASMAEFRDGGERMVAEAVQATRCAASAWASTPGHRRGAILSEIAAAVRRTSADLAALECLDSGKPLPQAAADVETAARYFDFYAGIADKIYGETIDQSEGFAYTRREPLGIVGVITPWNSPIAQLARSLAPALAAGNAVVAKPSELTPMSSIVLARLAITVGLPPGVLSIVLGAGPTAGAAIAAHADIAHVSFTGSVATGASVAQAAAARIASVTLELGGKSATIILADADLDAAANAGVGAVVRNAGQSCFATTRLLVDRRVHDALLERMKAMFAKLSIGPGLTSPDLGPLVSDAQLRRVNGYLERAIDAGARDVAEVTAPIPRCGYYARPVLLTNVTNDMEVAQSEVFGPVQVVVPIDDEDHGIETANDSKYGLAAGVFTKSLDSAHRLASRLEAGQVHINRYPGGGVDTPFGGYKSSGIGREKGVEALRHYTQTKTVIVHVGTA